jgi:DNA-binding Xre family transcriptional regulator
VVKGSAPPRESSQRRNFYIGKKQKNIQSCALEIVEYYKDHKPYTFGQALCRCMEEVEITVANLSARTGISERQIGRMRNDKVKDIEFRTIIAVCIGLNIVTETSERLLNLKRYTLNCDEPYVQLCKMFLGVRISVEECNEILKSLGFEPLTDGEIWVA